MKCDTTRICLYTWILNDDSIQLLLIFACVFHLPLVFFLVLPIFCFADNNAWICTFTFPMEKLCVPSSWEAVCVCLCKGVARQKLRVLHACMSTMNSSQQNQYGVLLIFKRQEQPGPFSSSQYICVCIYSLFVGEFCRVERKFGTSLNQLVNQSDVYVISRINQHHHHHHYFYYQYTKSQSIPHTKQRTFTTNSDFRSHAHLISIWWFAVVVAASEKVFTKK